MGKRNKGKSLIDFPKDYIILDIETTGLNPKYDKIIELSAIRIKNDEIVDEYTSLVKIKNKVPKFITKLTHIDNNLLDSRGKDLGKVMVEFHKFINKDDVIVGHNVNFDYNFLYDRYEYISQELSIDLFFKNNYIDILRLAKIFFKKDEKLNNFKLETLAKYYNIDYCNAHRSLADCKIEFLVLKSLKKDIIQKYKTFDNFINEYKSKQTKIFDLASNKSGTFNCNIRDHVFTFTGTLKNMTRKEAMSIVLNLGGEISKTVSMKTEYLVVGDVDYYKAITDGFTSKQKKAIELKESGHDIEIITEDTFYDMLEI